MNGRRIMIFAAGRGAILGCILEVVIETLALQLVFRRVLVGVVFGALALGVGARCLAQTPTESPADSAAAPTGQAAAGKGFLARWAEFYREDWKAMPPPSTSPTPASPARRGLP